jgi:nitrogen fixation protein FixH
MSTISRAEFKGRHMLAIMLAFFGVIIAVNATMAILASTSWTGFVVANAYVASQEFNAKARQARAQAALGWTSRLELGNGRIRFSLRDADGATVPIASGTATFRRPAYAAEDQTIALAPLPDGALGGSLSLGDGIWIVEVLIDAGLDHPYRHVRRLILTTGAAR